GRNWSGPPWAWTSRWLTAGPTSIRLSCTICTGSKRRPSLSAGTAAMREPMMMRTTSGSSGPAWRPTDRVTFASSAGELWARYHTRYESDLRSLGASARALFGRGAAGDVEVEALAEAFVRELDRSDHLVDDGVDVHRREV